jgi:hypothetical protein
VSQEKKSADNIFKKPLYSWLIRQVFKLNEPAPKDRSALSQNQQKNDEKKKCGIFSLAEFPLVGAVFESVRRSESFTIQK